MRRPTQSPINMTKASLNRRDDSRMYPIRINAPAWLNAMMVSKSPPSTAIKSPRKSRDGVAEHALTNGVKAKVRRHAQRPENDVPDKWHHEEERREADNIFIAPVFDQQQQKTEQRVGR